MSIFPNGKIAFPKKRSTKRKKIRASHGSKCSKGQLTDWKWGGESKRLSGISRPWFPGTLLLFPKSCYNHSFPRNQSRDNCFRNFFYPEYGNREYEQFFGREEKSISRKFHQLFSFLFRGRRIFWKQRTFPTWQQSIMTFLSVTRNPSVQKKKKTQNFLNFFILLPLFSKGTFCQVDKKEFLAIFPWCFLDSIYPVFR